MEPSTFDTHNCDASRVTTFFSPTGTVTVPDTQALSGGQRRANVQTFPPMPPDGLPRPGSTQARLIPAAAGIRRASPARRSAASQTRTARASWATRAGPAG